MSDQGGDGSANGDLDTPPTGRPRDGTQDSWLRVRDEPSVGEASKARGAVLSALFPEDARVLDGRYELGAMIGSGGLGRVYKALDTKLGRHVAVKFLKGASHDPELARALETEARVLARLQHPNIVAVHDVGRSEDELYLTMELIEGVSLEAWLQTKRTWREVVEVMRQAAVGLAAAHDAGVVHRDFKPANVMIDEGGRVRVVDFGLAREVVRTDDGRTSGPGASLQTKAAGTRPYMAPEQFDGEVSAASDQFAFCTTLYEGLCGRRPWTGVHRGIGDREDSLRVEQALKKAGAGRGLREVVLQGVHVDGAERFADMEGLLRSLSPKPSRRPMAAVGAVMVGAAVVAAVATQKPEPCLDRGVAAGSVWSSADAEAFEEPFEDARRGRGVAEVLDAFVADWNAVDRQTCEAQAHGDLSPTVAALRTRCLSRVAARVRTALAEVRAGDYDDVVVQRTIRSATAMESCRQVDALLVSAPEKGYDAEAGDRIQRAIDAAFVHLSLGNDDRWLSDLEAVRASIDPPGAALPDELWLAQQLGDALIRRGRLEDARALLTPALLEAKRHPSWVLQTSMLQVQLAKLASVEGRGEEAELLISVAEPPLSTVVAQAQHSYVAAIAHAQIASADARPQPALDHLERAEEIEGRAGTEAEGWAGIRGLRSDTSSVRCRALLDLRRVKEAESECRRSLNSLDESGLGRSLKRATTTHNLATAIRRQGRFDEAAELFKSSALQKSRLGELDGAAESWVARGIAFDGKGDYRAALDAYAEAERLLGSRRTVAAVNLFFNRGVSHAVASTWRDAVSDYERALELDGAVGDASEVERYDIEVGLGIALAETGDTERAVRVLERALRSETESSDPYSMAELRIALAPLVNDSDRRLVLQADARRAAAKSGDRGLVALAAGNEKGAL